MTAAAAAATGQRRWAWRPLPAVPGLPQAALAQLRSRPGGPVLHLGRLSPGPGPHVRPGGQLFHGVAEMFPGPFDLLLNFYFRCRHRCTLSLGFSANSLSIC